MLTVDGISCSLVCSRDNNIEIPVYQERTHHPNFRMVECVVNEAQVRHDQDEDPDFRVVIYRWNAPTDGQDLVVHLFRNGIPVCDPWYLDRSHIPVTQADKGNPRQDIVIDGSPGRSVGLLEVIITLAGADPIPMISTPVLFLQSNHIAYFRYYYRPAYNLYKKGIAHAADLLEQDKLGGSAPLTRKGSAPPRSSIKYPIRDPGQPSEVEPWSNGRTPVLNHQGYWARTPTVTAGFLGSIFMVTCFRQGYHFIVQAINDDRNFH